MSLSKVWIVKGTRLTYFVSMWISCYSNKASFAAFMVQMKKRKQWKKSTLTLNLRKKDLTQNHKNKFLGSGSLNILLHQTWVPPSKLSTSKSFEANSPIKQKETKRMKL